MTFNWGDVFLGIIAIKTLEPVLSLINPVKLEDKTNPSGVSMEIGVPGIVTRNAEAEATVVVSSDKLRSMFNIFNMLFMRSVIDGMNDEVLVDINETGEDVILMISNIITRLCTAHA